MRKLSRPAAAISAATLGLALLILTSSAAQAVGTVHRCGSGFVCVYPQDKGWNGDHPSYARRTYGAHILSNQFGYHYVLNNQYGGAHAYECSGYNGTDSLVYPGIAPGQAFNDYLTPVNPIVLSSGPRSSPS